MKPPRRVAKNPGGHVSHRDFFVLICPKIPFSGEGVSQETPPGGLATTGVETPVSEPEPVTPNLVRKSPAKTGLKPTPRLASKPDFAVKMVQRLVLSRVAGFG